MHEYSIAESVHRIAAANTPPGATLRRVTLEAGPMRGIDPQAMQWAWQALLGAEVELQLITLPWRVRCADCETVFQADDPLETCACGSDRTRPVGGDELRVTAIEVDERSVPCASP